MTKSYAKPQIANIINFIRGVEPREEIDLVKPVKKQLELLEKFDMSGTFLMQYDALINSEFTELLSLYSGRIEIGGWLEIVKPMCDAAGIKWRGREGFDWDWHANVGFTVGYTKKERTLLADVFMEKFKEVWGFYPLSVGSWIIDAHTLGHISDKYNIVASCNCKDQWGTDGYTLWGGYYNQAYYPSRNNVFCPAQSSKAQIPVPIFRMLGSDPIYQYDLGLDLESGNSACQKVVTLEPVYSGIEGGGGVPDWVDWFFKENYNGLCLSFGYAQIGQENSFGWDAMSTGLIYQLEKLSELSKRGLVKVETLAESGKWFKDTFETTPPSAVVALSDWKNRGVQSIWYNSKNYRINFLCSDQNIRIRDIHFFNEQYSERYEDEICLQPLLIYDNLPIVDGNRWSGKGILAGLYPVDPNGKAIEFIKLDVTENYEILVLDFSLKQGGHLICKCTPEKVEWIFPEAGFGFNLKANKLPLVDSLRADEDTLNYCYRGFDYKVTFVRAKIIEKREIELVNFSIKAQGKNLAVGFGGRSNVELVF